MTDECACSPACADRLTILVLAQEPHRRARLQALLPAQCVTLADDLGDAVRLLSRGGFDLVVFFSCDPASHQPMGMLLQAGPLTPVVAVVPWEEASLDLLAQGALEVLVWDALDEPAMRTALRRAQARQKAAMPLALQEEIVSRIVEQAPVGMALVGLNRRLQLVNEEFARIAGVERTLLTRLWISDLFAEDDAAVLTLEMGRLLAGEAESTVAEHRCLRQDGGVVWVHRAMRLMRDDQGRPLAYLLIMEDVEYAKRAEGHLKQTLRELEIIYENSLVGILELQGDRTIVRCNRRAAELLGYIPEELLGQSARCLHLSDETYAEAAQTLFAQLATRDLLQAECQLRRKDGELMWVQLWGKALSPPHLERGVIWLLDDITDRKRSEELRRDMERITQHDLKTPLNAILPIPELVRMSGPLNAEQAELLLQVELSAMQMQTMITRSLDLVRIEQGRYTFTPVSVDLCVMLRKVLKDLQPLARSLEVMIRATVNGSVLEHPGGGQTAMAASDPLLCYSILANLLRNALEACRPYEEVDVRIVCEAGCLLSVHNPGMVPSEIRPRFFEKYVSHGKPRGLGLGAYAVKLMTEVQGGTVCLESDERHGTTVTVVLPPWQAAQE
ncbi:sensor histidine kinase [Megalodesulfovibrio gigas]|uniref:histidine kinase n=1 Tax=Megalodesulfovibrio gigas (strain ATCC 19364 / DSM 1382 / NCIMB 9332 / VKM B-1759) TaxID=1121448 RepID=T2GCV2_MEGG1|nr:HAMP domain-containing sensor histidine kinase [Megalodesulfovibrio gigas]AGW14410.1 putative PAS domain S-box [Megalodesulfovibrio gigas DSM 1382 = ATCC 19364]